MHATWVLPAALLVPPCSPLTFFVDMLKLATFMQFITAGMLFYATELNGYDTGEYLVYLRVRAALHVACTACHVWRLDAWGARQVPGRRPIAALPVTWHSWHAAGEACMHLPRAVLIVWVGAGVGVGESCAVYAYACRPEV